MDKRDETLKPCPWCGEDGDAAMMCPVSGGWSMACWNCAADGPAEATEAEAIAAWNRRAPALATPGDEEKARLFVEYASGGVVDLDEVEQHITAALAAARAEGFREGVEKAAKVADAAKMDRMRVAEMAAMKSRDARASAIAFANGQATTAAEIAATIRALLPQGGDRG